MSRNARPCIGVAQHVDEMVHDPASSGVEVGADMMEIPLEVDRPETMELHKITPHRPGMRPMDKPKP